MWTGLETRVARARRRELILTAIASVEARAHCGPRLADFFT
jgi:hypothetical protein